MKALKIIGLGIGSLIVLLVVVSFFLSSTAHVERTVVMNAPVDVVFAQVNTLKNWGAWSPWAKNDPSMKIEFHGPESGVDASYSWEGDPEKSGRGTYTILESVKNQSIKSKLDFEGMGTSNGFWKFEEVEGGTKVTWSYESDMSSPPIIGRYIGVMMDGFLGTYFEQGLNGIKEISESASTGSSLEITELAVKDQWFLGIRQEVDMTGMETVHENSFKELSAFMKEKGLESSGTYLSVYHSFGQTIDIEVGISIADSVPGNERIALNKVKAGKAVKAIHRGHYEKLGVTHQAISAWMMEKGLSPAGAPWEVYITDPSETENPDEWVTEVYYPIASDAL